MKGQERDKLDIETCYKYFVFLNTECERYLRDKKIEEEEIANLKIEFDRFIKKALISDLPKELISKIAALELDYTYHPQRDNINMIKRLTFGRIADYHRSRLLKNEIEAFHFKIKGMPMYIKLHY
jgi:hypothetical protein